MWQVTSHTVTSCMFRGVVVILGVLKIHVVAPVHMSPFMRMKKKIFKIVIFKNMGDFAKKRALFYKCRKFYP